MRFFLVASMVGLVFGAASEKDCLDALQRCYDTNIFAIERFLSNPDLTQISDACMLYSNALKCMDSLPCQETKNFNEKKEKLEKSLYKDVAGACLKDGQIDNCIYKLLECEVAFQTADEDLKNHDSKAGCLEIVTFDKCLKEAQNVCPDIAIKDVYVDWEPLNKDAHREGCDPNCNDALDECTYELKVSDPSDKEEYCTALKHTKGCLERTQKNIGCSDVDSQKYLKKAVQQNASKYASQCDGVSRSVQASLLLIVTAIAVSVFSKRSFE